MYLDKSQQWIVNNVIIF